MDSNGLRRHYRDGANRAGQALCEFSMAGEKSIVSGMAGRYATALFELAHEERSIDAVKADLDRFDAMIAESADLARLVRSPVFTAEAQAGALKQILDKAGIGKTATHFLLVVTQNRRLFSVRQMIRDFRALVARHKGEASAEVTLAETPSDQHLDAIRAALKGVTGKDVQIDVKIDPSIIGGLTVKLGSRMVDASLRTKLNAIKFAMKEAR